MALNYESLRCETNRRSILTFDRSDEPFETQVLDICDILGVQVEVEIQTSSSNLQKQQEASLYGPREEWALRWLLKKFQSDDIHLGSPCLDFRAWLLLRALLIRMPLTITARLLNTYKFIVVIKNTLQWLQQNVDEGKESSPQEREDASATAESSSATLEASPVEASQRSRKRKRDGTPISPRGGSSKADPNTEVLYKSICSAIREMESLTRDLPDGSRGFAVEHMKATLRSSPEHAAAILGGFFAITNVIMRGSVGTPTDTFHGCISPMLAIWDLRSGTEGDLFGHSSLRAFSTHCLLPLLQLLITYQMLSPSRSETPDVTKSLDTLLAKYIIFPARSSFLSLKRSRTGLDEVANQSLYKDLLAPISQTTLSEACDVSPAAMIYSVAIGCLQRETPKQRMAENPWLQSLFRLLVESAFVTPLLPSNSTETLMRTLKSMLNEALDHNVLLDINMLETLLSRFSGLFSGITSPNNVDWDLVHLILKLNPDVFIRLSPQRASNEFLTTLLARITERLGPSMDHSHEYNETLSGVVLPLVRAFVHARDLTRFIDHWKQELTRYQERLEDWNAKPSIWEDDDLSQTVADFIKSALTIGQLRQVLLEAHPDLPSSVPSKTKRPLASLVILDCAISGCTSDQSTVELKEIAQSIYTSLLKLASDERFWNTLKMWRVWRTLTTINMRWSIPHAAPNVDSTEDYAIHKALNIVENEGSKSDSAEKLHAFNYILSFAAVEKSKSKNLQNPPCQTIRRAVRTILNHQEILSDFLSPEDSVVSRRSDSAPQWDGRTTGVESTQILVIVCQAQVLFAPETFHCLDRETQHRLLQQLFRGAAWQSMSNEQPSEITKSSYLNYLELWQWLLRSKLLSENALAAGCHRKLLITEYLESDYALEPEKLFVKMRRRLALESLHYIPVYAFDREERSIIANRLLREIMQETSNTAATARNISLLLKLNAIPSKSMNVLTKLNGLLEEEPLGNKDTSAVMLVSLAHNMDGNQSNVHIAALSGLKLLTQQIMKYQLSKIGEISSVNYLVEYYHRITQEVHRGIRPYGACALAMLLTTSLDFYSDHRNEFPEALNDHLESLGGLRRQHVESLRSQLDLYHSGVLSDPKTRKVLSIILECLHADVNFICTASNLDEVSSQLSRIAKELLYLRASGKLKVSAETEDSADYLSMRLANLALLLEKQRSELPHQLLRARELLGCLQSLREKRHAMKYFHDAMSKLEPAGQVDFLKTFTSIKENGNLDADNLLLLQRFILTLKEPSQRAEQVNVALSRVFSALCIELLRPIEFRNCILIMQCIQLLLQKQPQTIAQWNVDNTLTIISVVSSRLRSDTKGKHTGMIYLGLCRLFGTVLAVHRRKLGGRYHLIVPALQGLFGPLFIPYATTTASVGSGLVGEASLGKAHAAAYARLLTMLCSPTVSAVARSRKHNRRQELNDETKKARSIAGQHLPYLIMEYCTCQLKGRLLPEVKTALNPGLYAVLDVMQQEVMRTMNAAMDSSSRSIFKSFHEEYRRLGGGRRT